MADQSTAHTAGFSIKLYRLRMKHLQFPREGIQSVTGQANRVNRLLGDFIVDMLAYLLETSHRTEQIPGLGTFLVLGRGILRDVAYFFEDCPALHLIEWSIAVPRGRQSASKFSHDGMIGFFRGLGIRPKRISRHNADSK
jgi:hypothetical protein